MSDEQVRVACPACGKRFKMPADAVPAGEVGKTARCRGCGASFRVLREGEGLRAELAGGAKPAESPPTQAAAPKPKTTRARRAKARSPASGRRDDTSGSLEPGPKAPAPTAPAAQGRGPVAAAPFGIGDRVGRYEIEAVIARGGMGGIYKAYDPSANRHVALKVLVSTATDLDKLRFQREIQVQGNIQHQHIMPIFDSGVIGTVRFYTMELLKDPLDLVELTEQLHDGRAAKDPKLRPLARLEDTVRRVVLPICDAMHHANVSEGVLHRDLKPGNVLIDRNGLRTFVIDFGVSSLLEKKNARLAHLDRDLPVPLSGKGIAVTGTLVFMPPEQARGQADKRGDVWALGAILHYLVTGQPPLENAIRPNVSKQDRIQGLTFLAEQARDEGKFSEAQQYEEMAQAIREGKERTLDDLRRDVLAGHYLPRPGGMPKALDAIIDKALRPNPAQRYRHALELRDDLEAWLDGRPARALVQGSGTAGGALYRTRLFLGRHKALVAVMLLAVLGTIGVIRFWPEEAVVDHARLARELMDEAREAALAGNREEARRKARASLVHDAASPDAFALFERLDAAEALESAVARARVLRDAAGDAYLAGNGALGRAKRAALEEVLLTQVLPFVDTPEGSRFAAEMRGLHAFALGQQPLRVENAPAGASYQLFAAESGGGAVDWTQPHDVPAGEPGVASDAVITSGSWVLAIRRGRGTVYVPLEVKDGGDGVTVRCPIDPQTLDAATCYVAGGTAPGPDRRTTVQPLLWDRNEVTAAQYAAFLATLKPEEQRRRVPRTAGALGALGDPLWERDGNAFVAPAGASRRPVEGISLYDAKAYAAWAKKRLPTAAEWAWAASGPDGRVCAAGRLDDLRRGEVHIDRPLAGVADIRSAAGDRSPFGLWDMAGNVAEFTSTLGDLRGGSGWFVMGGSYLTPPARALVSDARLVPGWMPLEGVGLRCVRDVR